MYVIYNDELWKLKSPPVKETLMSSLRESSPSTRVEIQNIANSHKKKTIYLYELMFQFEN